MMENRPGGHRFSLEASLKIANNMVGEQITVEQLIEKRKVMTISKVMIMKYRHHVRVNLTETIMHLLLLLHTSTAIQHASRVLSS